MKRNRMPRYLRVSLLSACNLRCSYCRPAGKLQPPALAPEDKVRSAIHFLCRYGIRKVRFTGGEPTLYRGLGKLVSFVKGLDATVHTAITSNGVLLADQAKELSTSGLDSLNISLDTLDPAKFRTLTGSCDLGRVLSGIDAATEHLSNVKLNCVLIRGINEDEAERLISFADGRGLDIRFIEFMPNRYSAPGDPRFISGQEVRERLPWDMCPLPGRGNGAARYYAVPTLRTRVGFISSVSHPFCIACDRIRLTANGRLYTCLYDSGSIDLFSLLATDPENAGAEYERLVRSKRPGHRRHASDFAHALPSFSAMGG